MNLAQRIADFYAGPKHNVSFSMILRSIDETRARDRASRAAGRGDSVISQAEALDEGRQAELGVLAGCYHGRSLQRLLDAGR